jgi:ATP-dependent Clp protease ATP-binding subunit ClpA
VWGVKRFIDGSDQQFEWLRDQIQGALYIFKDVSLPRTCTPNICRLGFEYTPTNGYKAYIDKEIAYSGNNAGFRDFLANGEASFESYDNLIEFFRGLDCLYSEQGAMARSADADADDVADERASTFVRQAPSPVTASSLRAARRPIEIDVEQLYEGMAVKIIGQRTALSDLADAIQIHLAKANPGRPETLFMAGPTGVGKTESVNVLVKTLNEMTDTEFRLIRIDCNQYMESHRISQLLGSPPGYTGYGEPAALAPLAENPRCILLWDEIEKAHSNVLKAIMNAMDAGHILLPSPINGSNELDCRHAIFIFTSNLSLNSTAKKIGFSSADDEAVPRVVSDEDRCKEALVKHGIPPEIAGRIAWFLNYEPLSDEDIAKVIQLEIEQCARSFELFVGHVDDDIIDEIIQSTGSKFGMRAYKQLINRKFGKLFAACVKSNGEINVLGTLDSPSIEFD